MSDHEFKLSEKVFLAFMITAVFWLNVAALVTAFVLARQAGLFG